MLKCIVNQAVSHLHQGLTLGLEDDRERNSEALGRLALFKGGSQAGAGRHGWHRP